MDEFKKVFNESAKKEIPKEMLKKIFDRLSAGKYQIYKRYPFLGHILQRLSTVVIYDDPNIPTMAVDDKGNIYINAEFALNELSFDEFIGVLVHETMHIATLTFQRERGRDHQLWNVATDFIMNRDIIKSGLALPKGCCLPELVNGKYIVKLNGKNGPFQVDATDITAEYLYTQMMQNAIVNPPSLFDKVISGDGSGAGTPEPVPGSAQPISKTKEQIKSSVLSAAEAAKADQAEVEKQRGEGSGDLRNHVMSHHSNQVNWKQVLKNIVAKTVTEYNWKRPARRAMGAGYYSPRSTTFDNLAPICVAIDTSGSITDKELSIFVAELQNIFRVYKLAQITVVLWHSDAYFHVAINKSNYNNLYSIIKSHFQSGGTTMSSVADYLIKHHLDKKVAAVVYLTDGHTESTPKILSLPVKNYALVTDSHGIKALSTNKMITCYKINID